MGGLDDVRMFEATRLVDFLVLEQFRVQRAIAAPAADIFAILNDPQGHVAIDSSGMLMAASGEAVTGTGDTFVVHMDREALNDRPLGLYDVTVEIVTFEPDREIAWTVHGGRRWEHVYGYQLEPIADGTLVTSYYDWSAVPRELEDRVGFPVIPGKRTSRDARHPCSHGRPR